MNQTLSQSAPVALVAVVFCALTSLLRADAPATNPTTNPTTKQARQSVDNAETQAELLGQRSRGLMSRVRARMDESATRLGVATDPGQETQEIQRRILQDLDALMATLPKDPPPQADPAAPPDPANKSQHDASTTAANQPAVKSAATAAGAARPAPADIRERAEAFMRIAPHARQAVIDGATEHVLPKYKQLTEDYYRAIARTTESRP